jgi:hypothetical protein
MSSAVIAIPSSLGDFPDDFSGNHDAHFHRKNEARQPLTLLKVFSLRCCPRSGVQ